MRIHIVRPGDTLWKLAKRYNVPLQRLIDANPQIKNPNELEVGAKIRIPTGGVPVRPPSRPGRPPRPERPYDESPESPDRNRREYPMPEREWERESPDNRWQTMPQPPEMPYPPMYGVAPHMPMMPYPMYGMPYPMYGMGMPYPGYSDGYHYMNPYPMAPYPAMPPYQTMDDDAALDRESSSSSA